MWGGGSGGGGSAMTPDSGSWNVNAQEFVPSGGGSGGTGGAGGGGRRPMPPGAQFGFGKGWQGGPGSPPPWAGPPPMWAGPGGKGPPAEDAWGGPPGVLVGKGGAGHHSPPFAGEGGSMVPPQQLQQLQQLQQQQQQQQRAKSYAALWSLDASYNEQEVKEALAAIGFNPENLSKLGEGAFGLTFGDEYSGVAFSLDLDGIDPKKGVLKYRDEGVRAAPWLPSKRQDLRSSFEPRGLPKNLEGSLAEFA